MRTSTERDAGQKRSMSLTDPRAMHCAGACQVLPVSQQNPGAAESHLEKTASNILASGFLYFPFP